MQQATKQTEETEIVRIIREKLRELDEPSEDQILKYKESLDKDLHSLGNEELKYLACLHAVVEKYKPTANGFSLELRRSSDYSGTAKICPICIYPPPPHCC